MHDFYSFDAPGEIEQRIDEVCRRASVRYALTAFSGAERLAPFVRYQRATAYVEENLEQHLPSEPGFLKLIFQGR